MDIEKIAGSKIFLFFDNLAKIMIINLLWFFSTLIGLGIFTIMPASVCVFILVKGIIEENNFPIFTSFWKLFKKEYVRSQKLFFFIVILGCVLYFNVTAYYQKLVSYNSFISSLGYFLTIIFIFLCILALINLFLVYIYFPDFKTFKTFKYAFIFLIIFPFRSLMLLLIYIISFIIFFSFPEILPIFFLFGFAFLVYLTLIILCPKYNWILKIENH